MPHAFCSGWVRPSEWCVRAVQERVFLQCQRARRGQEVYPLHARVLLPVQGKILSVRGYADLQAQWGVRDGANNVCGRSHPVPVQLQPGWRVRSIAVWESGLCEKMKIVDVIVFADWCKKWHAQALGYGCQPCENGFYAPPGATTRCLACPRGKYAAQTTGWVDYMKCPSSDSPRIAFVPGTSSVAAAPSSCVSSMSVGATTCTSCPANRPYTWSDRSKTVSDCKQCPEGQFFSSATSSCRACKAPCNRPYFYETVPCTEAVDRQCAACGLEGSCDPVGEYLLPGNAGCPGPIDAGLFF